MSEVISRHDQKLEYILRKSASIFAEKSYHATSMRDISRETGVSLAGLYHYCASKEELLFLIQDSSFRRVVNLALERLNEAINPADKLRIFIENHLSFFAANMAEMKVLSHEADSLEGELRDRVNATKESYTKLARKILEDIQSAYKGEQEPIDLTVATYALFGMMNWIYNWYDPAGKLSVGALVENFTRLFLTGFTGGSSRDIIRFSTTTFTDPVSVWRER